MVIDPSAALLADVLAKVGGEPVSRPAFAVDDPFFLEAGLGETERQTLATARAFAERELAPRIQSAFRDERFDQEVAERMGAAGFFGASLPEPYGAGLSATAAGLLAQEVEAVDSAYRSLLSVQSSLTMTAIYRFGSAAQKNRWLPLLRAGRVLGAFALTEADGGSDPGAMRTRAQATADGFILSGSKAWISHAPIADVMVVWAKDDEGLVRGFLLERGMKGLSTSAIKGKLSLRASLTGHVFFDQVRIQADSVLPDVYGLKGPFTCLNEARMSIVWGMVGAARACWLCALSYSKDRQLFGEPLAAKPIAQLRLAEMQTEVARLQLMAHRLAALKDAGTLPPETISLAKRAATMGALSVARAARDLLGANGLTDDYPVLRHALNLEAVHTYEGTADIHALTLGRAQTGHAAF